MYRHSASCYILSKFLIISCNCLINLYGLRSYSRVLYNSSGVYVFLHTLRVRVSKFLWNVLLNHGADSFSKEYPPPILLDVDYQCKTLLELHFCLLLGKLLSSPVLLNMMHGLPCCLLTSGADLIFTDHPMKSRPRSQTTSSFVEDNHLEHLYYKEGLLFSIICVYFCFKLIWLNIWKTKTASRGSYLSVHFNESTTSRTYQVTILHFSKTFYIICHFCQIEKPWWHGPVFWLPLRLTC